MFKKLFGLFKKIIPRISSAMPVLIIITIILLNMAIWWLGPWLVINEEAPLASVSARMLACTIFILICLACWALFQSKKLNFYNREAKKQEAFKQDPIKELEERQEKELNAVMLSMKDNLNKRDYLYTLPWYLVMGLENSGKTSLINRSGQSFTFTSTMKAETQDKSNEYSFDWWIGDDSVLIDPDGELLTQGQYTAESDGIMEKRLWLHFVRWLEKTRSQRPLNGVVLTIDVSQLLTSTTYERKAYAVLLRTRIVELMEILSTRFPVYITLTKLDLLYGFDAFFGNYTKEQRDNVLGFTFSINAVDDNEQWLNEFESYYSGFVSKVTEVISQLESKEIEGEERKAIYSFSRQINGLKDILSGFLGDILKSDQFSTSALVRGVYFSSVYQQGVPTNAFDDAASRRYGLKHAINVAQNAKNSTIYFTQKLFKTIVYPEAGLASDNFRVIKQKRRLIITSFITCSIGSILLISLWHSFYLKNITQSEAVLGKVNQYNTEFPNSEKAASLLEVLPPLNVIRDATLEFGYYRDKNRYLSDLGLYQGKNIGPEVERTYLSLLETRLLPFLMAELMEDISKTTDSNEKLSIFRIFRMLIDESGRDETLISNYFAKKWQQKFSGNRSAQDLLVKHLKYAMQHTDLTSARLAGNENADNILIPYDSLVAKVQEELSLLPVDQRVYRNLKSSSLTVLGADINLRTLVGPVFDEVFDERVRNSDALYIPKFLSKEGFESYFLQKSDSVSDLALIDSWVLGKSSTAEFSNEDKKAFKEKIRSLYSTDYVDSWRSALNEINVKNFENLNNAILVLDKLTNNTEPLQRLLRVLSDNTDLLSAFPADVAARDELVKSPKYEVSSMISKPFSSLNTMLVSEDDKPLYINEVLEVITQLKNYLEAIQSAPEVGKAALEATKSRISTNSVDPIYTLLRVAARLPKPLDSMVAKLADRSWYVIKQEAIRYLEIRWQHDIYRVYEEKFAGRYPFSPNADKNVSLKDFKSFFAPNGTLDAFYNNQLKMFIDEDLASNEGEIAKQSIIRDEVLAQINRAKMIQAAFFNQKGVLDVSFDIEPVTLSSNKRRGILSAEGQYMVYSHGPKNNVEMIWPNTLRESAVSKVTLVPSQINLSPRSLSAHGPWALFRLFDQGNVVSASQTSVNYQFKIDNGEVEYRVNVDEESNPFTENLFESFELSSSLY